MIEDVLDMMQHDAEVSDELLQMLERDPEMKDACQDILYARMVERKRKMPNVDEQLAAFKKRHKKTNFHRLRLTAIITGTAAAILIAVLLMHKWEPPLAKDLVENIHIEKDAPVLTIANGQEVPVKILQARQLADPQVILNTDANLEIEDTLVLNVPYGKTYQVVLPDGSRVYLHPESRLVYPSRFYGANREVWLSGEAYFVITKDAEHPFIVSTPRSQTRVLGTEFDVTSYPNRPESVTLVTGSVVFKSLNQQNNIVISPGQQATMDASGNFTVLAADTDPYTMWRDGYFYFDNQNLKSVLAELGRYYDVDIESHNPQAMTYRVRFICRRDADLSTVINNINLMKICTASLENNKLIIR